MLVLVLKWYTSQWDSSSGHDENQNVITFIQIHLTDRFNWLADITSHQNCEMKSVFIKGQNVWVLTRGILTLAALSKIKNGAVISLLPSDKTTKKEITNADTIFNSNKQIWSQINSLWPFVSDRRQIWRTSQHLKEEAFSLWWLTSGRGHVGGMHKHIQQFRVCRTHDCIHVLPSLVVRRFPISLTARKCFRKETNLFRQENNVCTLETFYLEPGSYLNYTILLHPPAEHTRLQLPDVHPQPDSSLRDSPCAAG